MACTHRSIVPLHRYLTPLIPHCETSGFAFSSLALLPYRPESSFVRASRARQMPAASSVRPLTAMRLALQWSRKNSNATLAQQTYSAVTGSRAHERRPHVELCMCDLRLYAECGCGHGL